MAADVAQGSADLVGAALDPVNIPLQQADLEGVRRHRDAGVAPQTGQRRALGQFQVEGVHQRTEEQEELHARQHVAQTHPPADAEGHEVLRLADLTLGGEKAARPEGLGLVPEFRIHVHRVQQGHHLRTGWYGVAVQRHVPATRKGKRRSIRRRKR